MCDQVQSNPNQGAARKYKRSLVMLAICIALMLLATIVGSMVQTAGWKYTTEDLRDETNSGTISLVATDDGATEAKEYAVKGKVVSGVLFRPKKAEEGSRPAVVLSHGLYNNREMQLQNAIELVRRGYVVMVIDQASHGHNTSGTSSFFDSCHLDAAKYLYNLPEVDKSKVAVSGHSMGGMSTINVLNTDGRHFGTQKEENFKAGKNMGIVSAALIQAADTSMLYMGVASNVTAVGILKGSADEFFFGSTLKEETYVLQNRGVVTEENYTEYYVKEGDKYVQLTKEDKFKEKGQYYALTTSAGTAYYLQSAEAYKFTGRDIATATGEKYETVNGGIYANGELIAKPNGRKLASVDEEGKQLASATSSIRVIYQAAETHPMNHFSTKSASHVIDFFYNAFGTVEGYRYKAPTSQTWWIKEMFAIFGLVGLFGMIIPLIDLFLRKPLFASLKGEPAEAPELLRRPRKHVSYWLGGILTTIFGAISFHNLVDGGTWYSRLGLDKLLDNTTEGFIYANVGKIAAWGIMCALFALAVTGLIWIVNRIINVFKHGDEFELYDEHPYAGFKIRSWGNILKTICLAAIIVAIFYGVVNLIWYTTRVQFQVWVFGPRVFSLDRIASMLKYVPFFLVYYMVVAALAQNYRVKDLPEWATIAINVVFNIAGFMIMVWIANSTFIKTGAMIHTTAEGLGSMGNPMHYIHAYPIVPSIAIATVLSRRIYVRTGNAWLSGLICAILMTLIGCANTSINGEVAWVYGA